MSDKVLPVVQGDWVFRESGGDFEVARVRQSYFEGDEVYCDLVPYSLEGVNIGRQSPALGGPKSFEPWCLFTDNGWQRIEKPSFPLEKALVGVPAEEGRVRLIMSLQHDGSRSVKLKPVRTKPRKQSPDYARRPSVVVLKDSNSPDVEAASLRRAAQELRDQARMLDSNSAALLRQRASRLESEANSLDKPL